MNIHAIEVIVRGTLFVKSKNIGKSRYTLANLSTKTIDVTDSAWFSSAPFSTRPKVSFANKFSLVSTIPNSISVQVSEAAVTLAKKPFLEGFTWCAIHYADEKIDGQWPVFSVSVDLTGTVLVRAASIEKAVQAVHGISHFRAEEVGTSEDPLTSLVPAERDLGAELLLAGGLYLLGPTENQKFDQVWPDEPYPAANEIPLTLSDEFHYLSE